MISAVFSRSLTPSSLVLCRRTLFATSIGSASDSRNLLKLKSSARLGLVACLKPNKTEEAASADEDQDLAARIKKEDVVIALTYALFAVLLNFVPLGRNIFSVLLAVLETLPELKDFYGEHKWMVEVMKIVISVLKFVFTFLKKRMQKEEKEKEEEKQKEKQKEMDAQN